MPKGFFDDDSRTPATIRFRQVSHDGFEQNRRDRQIVCGAMCVLESLAKSCEGCRVLVVAVNVAQQADQLFESGGIDSAVFLQAVMRSRAKLIEIPSCLGYTNDGHIEMSSLHHRLQRREYLLVGQIAGGAKENERVRVGSHEYLSFKQPQIFLLVSPNVRRTRNAWQIGVCSRNRLRHVS